MTAQPRKATTATVTTPPKTPHPNDGLRVPFPPEQIGKLPKVTCGACRQAPSKNCDRHSKSECRVCGNWITSAHMHVDYVGHADVTNRLLDVDPDWDWDPMALTPEGLPLFDKDGGLWIKLTINGKTKKGYGNADGKRGGDAVKETIGDAIRNAGMRFGIALTLWSKSDLVPGGHDSVPAAQVAEQQVVQTKPEPSNRDWLAEAKQMTTEAALLQLGNECNGFGEFVGDVKRGLLARRQELAAQSNGAANGAVPAAS